MRARRATRQSPARPREEDDHGRTVAKRRPTGGNRNKCADWPVRRSASLTPEAFMSPVLPPRCAMFTSCSPLSGTENVANRAGVVADEPGTASAIQPRTTKGVMIGRMGGRSCFPASRRRGDQPRSSYSRYNRLAEGASILTRPVRLLLKKPHERSSPSRDRGRRCIGACSTVSAVRPSSARCAHTE